MDLDPGTAELFPPTKELSRSASAGIELREREIEALIRRGRLHPDHRADSAALRQALYGFLNHFLV